MPPTKTATAKKVPKKAASDDSRLKALLERYEEFFNEIDNFVGFVRDQRDELADAIAKETEAKEEYEAARDARKELEESIAAAKDSLYQLVEPGPIEFMPLLDRMEQADPEKHGANAAQWRLEPIAALKLTPTATRRLLEADIVAVGQLQDRVLADANEWYLVVDGVSAAMAAAIATALNNYIFEKERPS